jgi:hypothetical protein
MFSRSVAGSISAPSSSAIAPPYGPFEEADGGWPIAEETGRRIGPTSALTFRKRRSSLLLRRCLTRPPNPGRASALPRKHQSGCGGREWWFDRQARASPSSSNVR